MLFKKLNGINRKPNWTQQIKIKINNQSIDDKLLKGCHKYLCFHRTCVTFAFAIDLRPVNSGISWNVQDCCIMHCTCWLYAGYCGHQWSDSAHYPQPSILTTVTTVLEYQHPRSPCSLELSMNLREVLHNRQAALRSLC